MLKRKVPTRTVLNSNVGIQPALLCRMACNISCCVCCAITRKWHYLYRLWSYRRFMKCTTFLYGTNLKVCVRACVPTTLCTSSEIFGVNEGRSCARLIVRVNDIRVVNVECNSNRRYKWRQRWNVLFASELIQNSYM